MKKTNKIFNLIMLQIALIFAIGILGTFLSDYLIDTNWFGDKSYPSGVDWGARHYWYNWTSFLLVLISVIRCVLVSINIAEGND